MTATLAWTRRIAAGTPAYRDRTVDALRAAAIVGVIAGHWLVSAVVLDPYRTATVHGASPLEYAPWLAPATWVLETLGPFFFAGGYAASRGLRGRKPLPWLTSRIPRLGIPVLVLTSVWLPGMLLLAAVDAPGSTRQVVWSFTTHPLWFLLVYAVLTCAAPALRALVLRFGVYPALVPVLAVGIVDALRPVPGWLSVAATPVAWAAPYLLGIALAEGRLPRRGGPVLLAAGIAGGAALLAAGYPASAVGVPGQHWSNLDPPSLFALALAAAQLGAFLVLRPRLARLLARPAAWAPVAALNLAAMTLYCWHQTALILVTLAGMVAGPLPGLLTPPTGDWPWYRLLWLPVFAVVLSGLTWLFHRWERRQ